MFEELAVLPDTLGMSYIDLGLGEISSSDLTPSLWDDRYDFNSTQSSFLSFMSHDGFFADYGYHVNDQSLPWLLEKATRENSTCPPGHECVDAGYGNGMFVRDTADNKIYFSEAGWARFESGADIDWAEVAKDLLVITGGALGGVGAGVVSLIGYFVGLGGWAIDYWIKNGGE